MLICLSLDLARIANHFEYKPQCIEIRLTGARMKGKLLSYIDIRLNHHCHDPVEQMVYFIARLSLTASPVAWTVKNAESKADKPFLTYDEARDYIEQNGESGDYIAPLFATVKMELFGEYVRHLLLTPSPEQCD